MPDQTVGPQVTGTVLNTAVLSGEIDLGAFYSDVNILVNATEAAKMGTAAVNSIQPKHGSVYDFHAGEAGTLQSFSKPAAGGVQMTFHNVNCRYLKLSSSVAATADLTFIAQGRGRLTAIAATVQRKTLASL